MKANIKKTSPLICHYGIAYPSMDNINNKITYKGINGETPLVTNVKKSFKGNENIVFLRVDVENKMEKFMICLYMLLPALFRPII